MELNIHIPKIVVPDYLNDKKEQIEDNVNKALQAEIESIVDRHIRWYQIGYKILNCNHQWKTSYERTSAYDSEDVTKCIYCNTDVKYLTELLKK